MCVCVALRSNWSNKEALKCGNKWIVNDIPLKQMMAEVITKMYHDLARGDWCVTGEVNAWVDASSLAAGVVLERHGTIL